MWWDCYWGFQRQKNVIRWIFLVISSDIWWYLGSKVEEHNSGFAWAYSRYIFTDLKGLYEPPYKCQGAPPGGKLTMSQSEPIKVCPEVGWRNICVEVPNSCAILAHPAGSSPTALASTHPRPQAKLASPESHTFGVPAVQRWHRATCQCKWTEGQATNMWIYMTRLATGSQSNWKAHGVTLSVSQN